MCNHLRVKMPRGALMWNVCQQNLRKWFLAKTSSRKDRRGCDPLPPSPWRKLWQKALGVRQQLACELTERRRGPDPPVSRKAPLHTSLTLWGGDIYAEGCIGGAFPYIAYRVSSSGLRRLGSFSPRKKFAWKFNPRLVTRALGMTGESLQPPHHDKSHADGNFTCQAAGGREDVRGAAGILVHQAGCGAWRPTQLCVSGHRKG